MTNYSSWKANLHGCCVAMAVLLTNASPTFWTLSVHSRKKVRSLKIGVKKIAAGCQNSLY